MNSKEILEQALRLHPNERVAIAEGLLTSIDEPDSSLDDLWVEEAEKRLIAYRKGYLKGIPMEQIFEE